MAVPEMVAKQNPETATNIETDAMMLNGDTLLPRYFTLASDTLTIYTGIIFT